MNPRLTLAALAVASLFSIPTFASSQGDEGIVIITATRQATRHSELLSDSSALTRNQLDAAIPLETLGDLLSREGGVQTVTTGAPGSATSVFIRGANSGHTLLLIDGMRVGSATLGEPSLSRLPLSQVERVEILRGPASAMYGSDAIGGVIQVFTRPTAEGVQANASVNAGSYDTYEANAGIVFRNGGISGSLRAGHMKSDGFDSLNDPTNSAANPDKDGYHNNNVTASLAYAFDQNNEIGTSAFYSDGENQYDGAYYDALFTPHPDYNFRNRNKISGATIFSNNRLTQNWSSKLQLGRSKDDSTNFDGPTSQSEFNTRQDQISWQNDIRLDSQKFLLAIERLDQKVDTTTSYAVAERTIDSFVAGWTGVFASNHRLQANGRFDSNSQFGDKTTGNLGYGYQISDLWRVRSSIGTAFKAPTFNDLYYPDSFGTRGNPNLSPETSRSAEIGINRDTQKGTLAFTLYKTEIKDLISWEEYAPYAWSPTNIGQANIKGLTLNGKQQYGATTVRASYDYLDAVDKATNKQLVLRAKNMATMGVEHIIGDSRLAAEIQGVSPRYNNATNTVKLAGYSLVNLRVEKTLGSGLTLLVKANNVLDKTYEVRDGYATAGRNLFVGLNFRN